VPLTAHRKLSFVGDKKYLSVCSFGICLYFLLAKGYLVTGLDRFLGVFLKVFIALTAYTK
jgi:hypothetical protein